MSEPQRKKILVVDDEPDVVSYLETLLGDEGYATTSAGDGAAGLAAVRRERPDLVTLDISMPESSGTRLYRDLKADPQLRRIPVVIVTAVTGFDGDPRAYEKFLHKAHTVPPPEGFFPKPVDRETFLAAIRKLLG